MSDSYRPSFFCEELISRFDYRRLSAESYIIKINQLKVMSRPKSKRGRPHSLPIFINKLLEMVQDQSIEPVFGWTSTGDSFNIKSVTKFTEQVLPKYFKHKSLSSFIRQLNMYGFRKIRNDEGQNIYKNEYFKMGGKHQLRNISRRIREQKQQNKMIYNGKGSQRNESKELSELKSYQKNLEELCNQMLKQNQKLMEQNQNLIKKLENCYRDRGKKTEDFLLMLMNQKFPNQITKGNDGTLQICYGDFSRDEKTTNLQKKSFIDCMSQNLKKSEYYSKVRYIIDNIYGKMNLNKKEINTQIINNLIDPIQNEDNLKLQKDDDGFLSINSFMDIQEFQDQINLEESR